MTNTKVNNAGYLSFEQSIWVALAPASFFLLNGVMVQTLKTLNASVHFYLLLPIVFLLGLFSLNQRLGFITRSNIYKYLPVLVLSFIFAALHSLQYGTSVGSDSSSYFTNPIHTFYKSGVFSHSELPFIAYGKQPLASYWLPYNSEFIFAGIGSLFELKFIEIVSLMHFVSNWLFGLVILSILLRFMQLLPAAIFFLIFLLGFYSAQTSNFDLVSNSLFRGFENKGITWGFFLWASFNLFLPFCDASLKPKFLFYSGVLFGTSSFLVSGNAVFLLFPVVVLVIGAAASLNIKSVIFQFAGFVASLLLCVAIFKLLETTNVYDVVSADLTYRAPDKYQIQSAGFKSPLWLWALATALSLLVAKLNFRLSIQLLIFIVICQFVQSEKFFDLFFIFAPEFTLNFWRLAILMTPFLPILFSACYLLANYTLPTQLTALGGAGAMLIGGLIFGALKLPERSPFRQNAIPPQLSAIAELCEPASVVLADRSLGTRLPVLQPSYKYLVGKEYFLNWQIANLETQPEAKLRALNVRDASLYISKSPTTKAFGENNQGLVKTIADEKPDAIFLRTKRITPENEFLFSSYIKQTYRGVTVFTKADKCRTDFDELVKNLKALQE